MTQWMSGLATYFADPGAAGGLFFVIAYVISSIAMAPAFILTFMAGAIFGLWRGVLLVYVGAVLGSSAVYGLATPLARWRVLAWLDRDPRVAVVRRAVVGDGFWVMFLLRLSPLIPFVFLNYALALSGVRYGDYLRASVGMLPAIVMYVYYGKVVGDVAKLAAGVSPPKGLAYYAILAVGLVGTVIATTLITKAAKRAIQDSRSAVADA